MKKLTWLMLALVGSWCLAENLIEEETKAIVMPQWQVTLHSRTQYSPGMAVMNAEGIYFTHYVGNENCPGRNVIRVDLKPGHAERVAAELTCVFNIKTDGTHIVVQYANEPGRGPMRYAVWKEGQRLEDLSGTLPEAVLNKHGARVAFARDFGGVDPQKKSSVKEIDFGNERLLVDSVEGGPTYWDLTSLRNPKFRGDVPLKVGANHLTSLIQDLGEDLSGEHAYFQLAVGDRGFARFLVGNLKRNTAEGPFTLGSDEGLGDEWTSVAANEWAIASPRFFCPTQFGFVVYESSIGGDPKAISYYESASAKFRRAAVPGERFLTGVSYARNGLVISNAGNREIFWMGNDKSQFVAGEGFLEADIRRNPRLPAVEATGPK